MDTLSTDLLKLIDQYLDAKRSALIGVSTGLELFLSEYDKFSLKQWKWIAYLWALYRQTNDQSEIYRIRDNLSNEIDSGTMMFMMEHSDLYKHDKIRLDNKLIKEKKSRDVIRRYRKREFHNNNIYALRESIVHCIKHDCFELVEILTNYLIEIFGIHFMDKFYSLQMGDQYRVITRLLIEAHRLKNQRCIDYFESLCSKLEPRRTDRLILLIGLLSYDEYDDRTKILLSELKGDMNFIDIILHEVLAEGYNKGTNAILELIEGFTIQDKLKTICTYVEDMGLYDNPLYIFFRSALMGGNIEVVKEIITMTNNDQELYYYALEAYGFQPHASRAFSRNNYDVCEMIFEKSVGVRTIFQIRVNNIDFEFESDQDIDIIVGPLYIKNVECFNYIVSTFGCQFNLDYVQEQAGECLDFELFKRIVDFKNELIL